MLLKLCVASGVFDSREDLIWPEKITCGHEAVSIY